MYPHLKFYENSGLGKSLVGREESLPPHLLKSSEDDNDEYVKSPAEKHAEVLEYLRSLPRDVRVRNQ